MSVPAAAPRLDARLIDQLERLERRELSYAEIRRSLVVSARRLDVCPPSYEHVRRLVKRRRLERKSGSELLPIAVGVALGTKHGNELLRALNEGPPRKRQRLDLS